ncbi:aromatic amino acid lyase [Nocardioides sp. GXQ0305]|uniref:aromatic amino acid lyase n=1 Tax=Nocardioides sp. GXQ0305 TaxID=3423912 RepID=UPI003D7E0267
MTTVAVARPEDLGPAELLACAGGAAPVLAPPLVEAVGRRRREVLDALLGDHPVYGVTTGMGALTGVRLDAAAQAEQSRRLLVGRAVGGPPWLDRAEARAVVGCRLRTFLSGDAGVSPELCAWLVTLLEDDVVPAVPRSGSGAAGEIIPLAHAWGHLAGGGRLLDGRGHARPAAEVLAGRTPPALGAKEGVALLQGVPVATALALLRAAEADRLLGQWVRVAAAEILLVGATRDPYLAAAARADEVLGSVLDRLREMLGEETQPPLHLQAPVSFRVIGPVLAQLARSLQALRDAVDRALAGVTDSPAWLEDDAGARFVGTAGFHGLELAAACDGVRFALLHAAEVGAARLHRLLDPAFTGLPAQLSADPGPQAGLVAVHKAAVGSLHAVSPATFTAVGTRETSRGQEDVQSYALTAAERLRTTLGAARRVVASELLAVHQGRLLAPQRQRGPAALREALDLVATVLPEGVEDRAWGEDLEVLDGLLVVGWPGSEGSGTTFPPSGDSRGR